MEVSRPNRSDAHLSREEETKVEEETRAYFDGQAPVRHSKPQRSDYSSQYKDAFDYSHSAGDVPPEFQKFHDLEHRDTQKLTYSGNEAPEEYVETEYYKDLNCVDKQHHTTGTGFIKVDKNGGTFNLMPDVHESDHHDSCKGNPATNEWIPSMEPVFPVSHKPKRSEN
ncbi:hypothetical protein EJ110_NYTH00111 [Nymphaea thermarum]|nr:hypothetical protein EJ110_NYTH00111 [Nymphaea thermarum]